MRLPGIGSPLAFVARIRPESGNEGVHSLPMLYTNSFTRRRSKSWFKTASDGFFPSESSSGCVFIILVAPAQNPTGSYLLQAGAQIRENLQSAHIILGIKEVPLPELISAPLQLSTPSSTSSPHRVARTHLMFSHTTKGQPYNMPLLSRFTRSLTGEPHEVLPRLIDYELLTDANGKRTVGFGWFAGGASSGSHGEYF
jgi:hypothetical protein